MIAEPEKELRFTRSGQAVLFWLAAAVCLAAGTWAVATLGAMWEYRPWRWILARCWWAFLPLVACFLLGRTAVRLTRKAYLILTPLGVEIFPFFRPAGGMRLVSWVEIDSMDTDGKSRLTLHFDREKTGGIHLSLRPIAARKRALLVRALQARVGGADNS